MLLLEVPHIPCQPLRLIALPWFVPSARLQILSGRYLKDVSVTIKVLLSGTEQVFNKHTWMRE